MGAASSTENSSSSPKAHEQESLASASLALPLLRAAFSRSAAALPDSHPPPPPPPRGASFCPAAGSSSSSPPHLDALLAGIGPAIASLFFVPAPAAAGDAGDAGAARGSPAAEEGRRSRRWSPRWRCPSRTSRTCAVGARVRRRRRRRRRPLGLGGLRWWRKGVTVQEFTSWVLSTAPGLGNCLSRYVQGRFRALAADPVEDSSASTANTTSDATDVYLLTRGIASGLSLGLRSKLSEKFLSASVIGMDTEDLLYRSSVHGRELSRFWSCVEGYKGPMLILLSALSNGGGENVDTNQRWGIGVLTEEGFENKDTFYGSSGFLCATNPIFRVLQPAGKEKNFMYCYIHPQIRAYEAKPKPVGLAFGGTLGNESIFLDEDFSRVIVRHHAVDKTYQHGSLIPNQGYLPVEALVLDVEVWGLGGETTKRQQDMFQKRETVFSEQRRKVPLRKPWPYYSLHTSLLECPTILIIFPFHSFRLISKLLATGKTLQRK